MEKVWINYWIDVGLLISGIIVMISGILKLRELSFLNIYKIIHLPTLSMLHDYFGVIFTILVIIHLVMHFNWIMSMTKTLVKKGKKC